MLGAGKGCVFLPVLVDVLAGRSDPPADSDSVLGVVPWFVESLGVRGLRADFKADFSLGCELDCTEGVDGTDRGAQSGLGVEYDVGESVDCGVAGRRVDDPDEEGEDDTG